MAKIDRLEKRQQKNYTDRRQIRLQKQEMKDAGKSKQEVRSVKLQTKAASTLGTAKKLGAQDTEVGVNKMARLGQKYNRQVGKAKRYNMQLGSKEINTPGVLRHDATNTLSSTSKNIQTGGTFETKAVLKSKMNKDRFGNTGERVKSMSSYKTSDDGFTTMESGKHTIGKSKFLTQNKETGQYQIVKQKRNVVSKSKSLSSTSGMTTNMHTTTTTKGVVPQSVKNISARRAARIMKRNPNIDNKVSKLSKRRTKKLAKKLGGPQMGIAGDYYKNN